MFTCSEAKVENGQLVLTGTKQIDQSKLTSDCWLVQFNGLTACENCEARNTPDCGGGETLKRLSA
jgi:hypothetical protein